VCFMGYMLKVVQDIDIRVGRCNLVVVCMPRGSATCCVLSVAVCVYGIHAENCAGYLWAVATLALYACRVWEQRAVCCLLLRV